MVVFLHNFPLTMFIKWLPSQQVRDDCISTNYVLLSSFWLQSTLLQEKSNDIKICSVKTIFKIIQMWQYLQFSMRWEVQWGNTEDQHHTYIMIHFAQREKILVVSLLEKKDLSNTFQLWSLKSMPWWMQTDQSQGNL